MKTGWKRWALHAVWTAALLGTALARAENFLDVDQAFLFDAQPSADGGMNLQLRAAPGYHLYRERIVVVVQPKDLHLLPIPMPQGVTEHDDGMGRDTEVYRGTLTLPLHFVPATPAARTARMRIEYQGCADAGLCYPPQSRELALKLGPLARVQSLSIEGDGSASPAAVAAGSASSVAPAAVASPAAQGAASPIGEALRSGRWLTIAPVFLLAGLLLSFTPCVLPMVPILSSIIVGQGGTVGRRRGFSLALSYALGMASIYTAFGIAAGLLGEGLAAWMQNPYVIGGFGLLMAALALSMFGVYELQLPPSLQTRLSLASGRIKGGNHAGVFLMGGLSALIVGPCVAAPLAGALVYISQTRDVVIGGLALFCLACGMSVPLLLVGLSAGSLLPRVGAWMTSVKALFGMLLLAVAWWLVSPVIPPAAAMLLLAVLLALGAALLGAFTSLEPKAGFGRAAGKAVGWILASAAVAQVAGALAGASSPWQPLQPLSARAAAADRSVAQAPVERFASVNGADSLQQALHAAVGRPVVLDFYADWCVSCKEMEHRTFSDPQVRKRLSNAVLLQADVTANTEAQRALLKQFGLYGPPGVLFFDSTGQELQQSRVIGFEDAAEFLRRLDSAGVL